MTTRHGGTKSDPFFAKILGANATTNLAVVKETIPAATIARLPLYLRCLSEIEPHRLTCSSDDLAMSAGVNSAQVRKDLSYLDAPGVRGVGYNVSKLRKALERTLGLMHEYRVVIAGAGNLGRALTPYPAYSESGFTIVGVFDVDPEKVGTTVSGLQVSAADGMEDLIRSTGATIGIIATPAGAAQHVADRFVTAGIKSILNFAPAVLKVPEHIHVRRVDLSTELRILAYYTGD
jgi:redox-sensing transcriptional repressor